MEHLHFMLDKMGLDKMGLDKMGLDEMGSHLRHSPYTEKLQSHHKLSHALYMWCIHMNSNLCT